MLIRLKLVRVPPEATDIPLGRKQKRGSSPYDETLYFFFLNYRLSYFFGRAPLISACNV